MTTLGAGGLGDPGDVELDAVFLHLRQRAVGRSGGEQGIAGSEAVLQGLALTGSVMR